jgi:hypothetical protein
MFTMHYTMPKGLLTTRFYSNRKVTLADDICEVFSSDGFIVHISETVKDFDWVMISGDEARITTIMTLAFSPLPPELGVRKAVC